MQNVKFKRKILRKYQQKEQTFTQKLPQNHRYSVKVRNSQSKTFIRNKAHIKKYQGSNKKPNKYNKTKTITVHHSTNKHELPLPLVTLVPDPPHDNDEMVVSDNESNTSESTVPYMLSESDSNEVHTEPVTGNIEITHKTKSNRIVTKPKRFRDN